MTLLKLYTIHPIFQRSYSSYLSPSIATVTKKQLKPQPHKQQHSKTKPKPTTKRHSRNKNNPAATPEKSAERSEDWIKQRLNWIWKTYLLKSTICRNEETGSAYPWPHFVGKFKQRQRMLKGISNSNFTSEHTVLGEKKYTVIHAAPVTKLYLLIFQFDQRRQMLCSV